MKYIIIPILMVIISQSLKVIIEFLKYKKITFWRFIDGMGGMPSTHSVLVSSLSAIIYIDHGICSLSMVTFIFSLIIIYDSMGIRYESGRQAQIINNMAGTNLEERIGHRPIEVLVGVILGIVGTIVFSCILK